MRYLGLVAALVLVLCAVAYFTRQPVVDPIDQSQGIDRYVSAINAARGASKNVDADGRRKWVLSLQMADYDDASQADQVYSTEGEDSEVLVIISDAMDSGRCSSFASGSRGLEAAGKGFTKLICRDRSIGTVYELPLKIAD